jgi:predicted outer membrane protein
MKTPVKGNRDQLVKEHRLEIRLTKVQKDALQDLAKAASNNYHKSYRFDLTD